MSRTQNKPTLKNVAFTYPCKFRSVPKSDRQGRKYHNDGDTHANETRIKHFCTGHNTEEICALALPRPDDVATSKNFKRALSAGAQHFTES